MYRRLNITLSEDVLARVDAFAQRERYTRSGLISAALDAFMRRDPRMFEVEGSPGTYAPESVGLNPAVRRFVPAIIEACRKSGVTFAGLVGASTRPDPALVPRELELQVRFAPRRGLIQHSNALQTRLEMLSGLPVRITDVDTITDEQRESFERTLTVLYDADTARDAETPHE
jgi:hypothetical protein